MQKSYDPAFLKKKLVNFEKVKNTVSSCQNFLFSFVLKSISGLVERTTYPPHPLKFK